MEFPKQIWTNLPNTSEMKMKFKKFILFLELLAYIIDN